MHIYLFMYVALQKYTTVYAFLFKYISSVGILIHNGSCQWSVLHGQQISIWLRHFGFMPFQRCLNAIWKLVFHNSFYSFIQGVNCSCVFVFTYLLASKAIKNCINSIHGYYLRSFTKLDNAVINWKLKARRNIKITFLNFISKRKYIIGYIIDIHIFLLERKEWLLAKRTYTLQTFYYVYIFCADFWRSFSFYSWLTTLLYWEKREFCKFEAVSKRLVKKIVNFANFWRAEVLSEVYNAYQDGLYHYKKLFCLWSENIS